MLLLLMMLLLMFTKMSMFSAFAAVPFSSPVHLWSVRSKAKLVSSMDDLAPLAVGVGDGTSPKLGQELLHNVGLMVGLAETEIQASIILTRPRWLQPGLLLQRDRRVTLTHDAYFIRGSVVSLSFMLVTIPREG